MFKINNKDTRTMPLASTPCSSVSVVNFEHVIAGWVFSPESWRKERKGKERKERIWLVYV